MQASGATGTPACAGGGVRELRGLDELRLVEGLFHAIWGPSGGQVDMPVNLLQALVHSGNYVAGSFSEAQLVSAGVGFLGTYEGQTVLHSHIVGVHRRAQGSGAGLELKLHQRRWALERGIRRIMWTFDPLVRRNAWFNLVKLGAGVVRYYPDLYGVMDDDLNGTDETDRCLVLWELADAALTERDVSPPPVPALPVLVVGPDESPVVKGSASDSASALMCQVPEDIVILRRRSPRLAGQWRVALRDTMGAALAKGYSATTITRDGHYLLQRPDA